MSPLRKDHPMADHVPTLCDDCGQTDPDPKVHYGEDTYHHDCLPPRARRELLGNPMAAQIIKACEKGKRGDALRAHIFKLHETTED
jgi:hypothetical protein